MILLLGLSWSLLSHSADAVIPPAEWHWAAIHGHRIYYATRGSGSTLVLLHGGGDSGEHSFARQLDVFSQRHRIVAPDQVGQGRTPDVPGPLTYTGMMDDTAALLRHLELKRVDVVGFSDGGILALMLAVRHPELVRRLVISGVNVAPEGLNAEDLDELRATQSPHPKTIDEKLAHLWLTSPTEAELNLGDARKNPATRAGDFRRPGCHHARTYPQNIPCSAGGAVVHPSGHGSRHFFRALGMAEPDHQCVPRTLSVKARRLRRRAGRSRREWSAPRSTPGESLRRCRSRRHP